MENQCEIRQYKKRWINLVVFVMYAVNNGVHWSQFSIINNVISEYYHVSSTAVEWTTCIFMLVSVILVAPVLFLLDKIVSRYG